MPKCLLCSKEFKDSRHRSLCGSCRTKIRRQRTKLAAVKQLGKKCSKCGYDKNSAALQFHHIDPKTKSFNFGNVANKSWKSISSELDKCILLCANCHAIEHSTRDNELFIKWVASYQGKKLDF